MILMVTKREETKRIEQNPQTMDFIVGTRCKDMGQRIRHLQEDLWQGRMKLHELNDAWAQLRKRSMTLDEEICKLETKVAQASHENICMMRSSPTIPTTALERFMTLLSWLPPHLTKEGSIPYNEERDARACEGCPQPRLARKAKPRTRGATT